MYALGLYFSCTAAYHALNLCTKVGPCDAHVMGVGYASNLGAEILVAMTHMGVCPLGNLPNRLGDVPANVCICRVFANALVQKGEPCA